MMMVVVVVACGENPNQTGHMVFTEPFVHYKPVTLACYT
jgi:hypothetical protein